MHWTLDVVFDEDQSRTRKDNAGENMALIRHITINMLNMQNNYLKILDSKLCEKIRMEQ